MSKREELIALVIFVVIVSTLFYGYKSERDNKERFALGVTRVLTEARMVCTNEAYRKMEEESRRLAERAGSDGYRYLDEFRFGWEDCDRGFSFPGCRLNSRASEENCFFGSGIQYFEDGSSSWTSPEEDVWLSMNDLAAQECMDDPTVTARTMWNCENESMKRQLKERFPETLAAFEANLAKWTLPPVAKKEKRDDSARPPGERGKE